ncbi:DUF2336 domain-containing protein [Caulobacter endophyticus]|uniref:DUF2336 domain-containing protein n=1 Tax=Caulobacter endophyticus TaxID=2172652 RepID=UPI00240EBBD2|nr:DUF2336 domain-containing protein [Caulobacter endophyticus]MDG2528662.1 DUF2336 domain-containing protein [Caulobacter endophyticus]
MSQAVQTAELLALARSREPEDRERLLAGIVDLCETGEAQGKPTAPEIQVLLDSIFMTLVVEAEREIRQRLAERLADAAWAPSALVNILALDEIEIARPIIARSPVLQDHDLIRLLVQATLEHQIEVARRPHLRAPVVEAILSQGEPAVMTALAGNATAEINQDAMGRLVAQAKEVVALRSPLARHPGLSPLLAEQLYLWVGRALRDALTARFDLDPARMQAAVDEATHTAHLGPQPPAPAAVAIEDEADREEMEAALVEKLDAAGQLRPGYLLRVLREGRLPLFVFAMARLGRFDVRQVRRAIDSNRPELLALACSAVGIDRSVFPTILEHVRQLNGGRPGGGAEAARKASGAFGPFRPDIAAMAFRQAVSAA